MESVPVVIWSHVTDMDNKSFQYTQKKKTSINCLTIQSVFLAFELKKAIRINNALDNHQEGITIGTSIKI